MRQALLRLVRRHRLVAKRAVGAATRVLPRPLSRRLRALAEQVAFRVRPEYQADTLPPIFHYWSSRNVAQAAGRVGLTTPERFYTDRVRAAAARGGVVEVLSLGSGACGMELALAGQLRAEAADVPITCMDFNRALMDAARSAAAARGLDGCMAFVPADCNRIASLPQSDVVVVNQFFHHVEELDHLCSRIAACLRPGGVLLTSEVISRNGHLPWPDTERFVQRWWSRLPPAQRFDRYHGREMPRYAPVDHAAYSSEGVRAQDIVRTLATHFDFETFLTFGAGIMPFVERRVGFNFDPDRAGDRALIDAIHAEDAANVEAGRYPAVNISRRSVDPARRRLRTVFPYR